MVHLNLAILNLAMDQKLVLEDHLMQVKNEICVLIFPLSYKKTFEIHYTIGQNVEPEHSLEQFGKIEDYLPDPAYEELKNGGPQVFPRGPPPSEGLEPSGPSDHSGMFSRLFTNKYNPPIHFLSFFMSPDFFHLKQEILQ